MKCNFRRWLHIRCKNLFVADSAIVRPSGNFICGKSILVTGVTLYVRTIMGNYRDFSEPGTVLKSRNFVENPSRRVFNMFGIITGEYNLTTIRPFTEEFGLPANTRMSKKAVKQKFLEKYPDSYHKNIPTATLD